MADLISAELYRWRRRRRDAGPQGEEAGRWATPEEERRPYAEADRHWLRVSRIWGAQQPPPLPALVPGPRRDDGA